MSTLVHVLCTERVFCTTASNLSLSSISKALMVNCTVTRTRVEYSVRAVDEAEISLWVTGGSSQAQAPSLRIASSLNAPLCSAIHAYV